MRTKQNDNLSISDLSCAAALVCQGIKIINLECTDPPRFTFIFLKNPKSIQINKDYWEDNLKVNPREYFNCLKQLKSLIQYNKESVNR